MSGSGGEPVGPPAAAPPDLPDQETLDRIFREEYGRVVATLARRFGSLDVAEDAASEAVVVALERWSQDGLPPHPGGWLTTTATRRALDRVRRESRRDDKHRQAALIVDPTSPEPTGPVVDDRLRLIFVCAHPALAPEARVALTLRLVGGLTVPEIASAFLVGEATMGQRITRAKRKIAAARIPFRVPEHDDLRPRLAGVLAVLYLIFNEGYLSTSGGSPDRIDLTAEAIRLGRLLRGLLPTEPEVAGLLALMLLIDARRDARFHDGLLVPLTEQDRTSWNQTEIDEGLALVRECLAVNRPGPYQVQAAVNAVHSTARTAADTDWSQIHALYGQLLRLTPSPVVELNRAVAVAELDGPEVGLAVVDRLALTGYHAWHATRADLLRRLGRADEARAAYDEALALTANPAEGGYLTARRDSL